VRRAAAAAALALALAAAPALAAPTPPTVTPHISGAAGREGWFVGPVTVQWEISGTITAPFPGPDCADKVLTADTTGTVLTCTAYNNGASTTGATDAIRIDRTPPDRLTAVPARPPDASSWYTAPVAITWTGKDDTSQIASCTSMTYAGPDGPAVTPAGTCTDHAGNSSTPVGFPMAFDATPPALSDVAASLSGTTAKVRWTPGADVASATVTRQDGTPLTVVPGAREASDGPLAEGGTYAWTVTVRDTAGNATSATASAAVPTAAAASLAAAQARQRIARPVLRWRRIADAKYYNLQLFRGTKKVLTAWPTKPRFTLARTWHYRGKKHRLAAGKYRWYVWAGYGPRARHRYGKLLARGTLKVTAAQARGSAA
jgi:hypothetical protein